MNIWRSFLVMTFGLLAAGIPAMAGQNGAVQCEVNEERVWVYDSLANLNVEARLNCGDTVEILGQEKGYVRIRTTSGRIGYIPKDTLPNLPAATTNDGNPAADQPVSLAEAAMRARLALEKEREPSAAPKTISATAMPEKRATVLIAANPPTQAGYVAAEKPAQPEQKISNRTAENPVSAVPARAQMPPAPSADGAPPVKIVLTASAKDAKEAQGPPENPAVEASPAAAPAAMAAVLPVRESVTAAPAPPAAVSVPTKAPAPAPVPAPAEVAAASPEIPATTARPARTTSAGMRARHAEPTDASMDEEDDADASLSAAEVSRQNCSAYFSAYGLTPNQFRWLTISRKKKFPGICPASLPSLVDYVIIFTHDVNFYNYTMPTPVRVDAGGMSDWTPMG
ncbi:MAG: hypothetical protein ACRD4M_13100, partial [Candidatus Acidiferrales bacterium]